MCDRCRAGAEYEVFTLAASCFLNGSGAARSATACGSARRTGAQTGVHGASSGQHGSAGLAGAF